MRDRKSEVEAAGLTVLGISFDDVEKNRAFAEKYGFEFPLLCDTTKEVAIAYGAAADRDAKFASRVSFVIGPEGTIEHVFPKVNAKTHLDDVLAALGV